MKHIGIVSKEAHAKSHGQAIRKMGHQVTMLGGSPQSIPPSIDIVICRPASVSHNGYNCTMKWKRKGGEAIITNSLDAMVAVLTDTKQHTSVQTEFFRSQDVVMHFSHALGLYGPHLHDERSRDTVTQLAVNRSTSAQEVDDVLLSWEGALRSITRDAIRSHCKKAVEKKESSFRKLYSRRLRGGVRTYGFAVEDNDALALFLSRSDLNDSRPSGKRVKKTPKKTFVKPKAAAVPHRPPEPAVSCLIAPDPVPVSQAVKTESIGVSPPESAPLFASATPVEASGGKGDGMADLRSAMEMLLAEMDELSISEMTIKGDGTYSFRRIIHCSGKVDKTW